MSKIYKEIAFNFTKALNKLELRTNVRSFISMRKAEKVIFLLFEIMFDKLERDGKHYFEFIDNRKK